MPEREAGNSVWRSSLSLSDPSTSFVFIRTLVRYGGTIGAASHCDGFPILAVVLLPLLGLILWFFFGPRDRKA
jgi:hypothetical protein